MKPHRALRQIPATAGDKERQVAAKISPVIAANSGKFIVAFCRNLLRAFRLHFLLTISLGDGVILPHSISASSNASFFMIA
jgi:hypothetical protein